jgi:hypothetical protein
MDSREVGQLPLFSSYIWAFPTEPNGHDATAESPAHGFWGFVPELDGGAITVFYQVDILRHARAVNPFG